MVSYAPFAEEASILRAEMQAINGPLVLSCFHF